MNAFGIISVILSVLIVVGWSIYFVFQGGSDNINADALAVFFFGLPAAAVTAIAVLVWDIWLLVWVFDIWRKL